LRVKDGMIYEGATSVVAGAVFLFPGQGTLRAGMGCDLYRSCAAVRGCIDAAASSSGLPLLDLMSRGPAARLAAPDVAQLAVVALSLGLLRHLDAAGIRPAAVAGHSAGEFSALVAAGVLDERDAVELVVARGRAMADASLRRAGGMVAITGMRAGEVEALLTLESGDESMVVAACNSPIQFVVSGEVAAVERVAAAARRSGALRVDSLAVGGAFHSPLMAPAQHAVEPLIRRLPMRSPGCTLVSSITGDVVTDVEDHRMHLIRQITSPVRWADAMGTIKRRDAQLVVELGPGRVLSALARRSDPSVRVVSLQDAQSCERFVSAYRAVAAAEVA
jgi:[acyl-carrier-protein] S-malonyltransferase